MKKPRKWIRTLLIAGILWGQFTLAYGYLGEPTAENLTLFFAIESAGLYTLLLFLSRKWWIKYSSMRPEFFSIALGSFNAAFIETEFWVFERIFGAAGVAAHPNLLMDLLLTMPWYIGVVWLFVRGYQRSRFPDEVVLLLGGLYEIGGDGIVGGIVVPAISGEAISLLSTGVFLLAVAFWQFILVYSSILLPPAWVLKTVPESGLEKKPLQDALKPMLWVIPFSIYVILMMLILFANS